MLNALVRQGSYRNKVNTGIFIDILEYRLLKGTLFASLVLSMAAATKKEKKRRSLPLEGWR
jgi:hypothetical protein